MTTVTLIAQVIIQAPLKTVFDYVSDLSTHPQWSGGQLKIEPVKPDAIGVGKEYNSRGQVGPEKERHNQVTVNLFEPSHKFGFVSKDPGFGRVVHVFTFSDQGGDVLVTRTTTLSMNPVMAFLFRNLIYPMVGNPMMQKSFANLKSKLEK